MLMVLMIGTSAYAQSKRGALSNTFAQWYNVTTAQTTITLPEEFESRDVTVHNGSTTAICLSIKGESIGGSCTSTDSTKPSQFFLDANTAISLSDFKTNSIAFKTQTGTASPVNVVITY